MSLMTLSIINLEQLQHNVAARYVFDRTGGTIGSAAANWQINDRECTVAPIHCEIRWLEGRFCVIDLCQLTYLNDSLDSLPPLTARRLREGDRLRIGAYRLQVQLSQADVRSLADLLNPEQSTFDRWLQDCPAQTRQLASVNRELAVEICSLLQRGTGNDPLAALETGPGPAQKGSLEQLIAGEHP